MERTEEMSTKTKAGLVALALLTAFASGRFSAPEKVRVETKTSERDRDSTASETEERRDVHKTTVVTESDRPDGIKEITTKIVEDTTNKKDEETTAAQERGVDTDTEKTVTRGSSSITVLALGGASLANLATPVYGAAASRPILGPVTVGAWGLSNGTVGASIGLTF